MPWPGFQFCDAENRSRPEKQSDVTYARQTGAAGSGDLGSQKRVFSGPNNRVRSHIRAAKPPLTALCNSPAPLAALGKQESVRRVVVRKSVARTYAVPRGAVRPRLDLHNRRAEP